MTIKVLIVDDDQVDRQIVKRALKLGNITCKITETETVDDGLAIFSENDFDLILLDYRLPGRDGIEMVISIRDSFRMKSTAIVMMSNSEDEQVALAAIQSGAQDFLIKSEINASRLKRAILHAQTRFELEKKLHDSYDKVKQLAERDSLTGLANRYLFDESLKFSVSNNVRSNQKLALLLIDLDQFKYVNDNFGHDVGDILLRQVVERIHGCLRGNELFARLGGDEFAITLSGLEQAEYASKVSERILASLERAFEIQGHSISSGASIGIAIYPDNAEHPEQLFKYADIAMYRAKKLGRNQACYFEEEMQEQAVMRFEIEQDLKAAIRENRFFLRYQPVFRMGVKSVFGFEALLYLQEENGSIRSPLDFIRIAEESRLIIELGRWVIETAFAQLQEWNSKYAEPKFIAINLSAMQLTDRTLIDHVGDCLRRYKISSGRVIFELTETALLNVSAETIALIDAFHELGCHVALDDFGTGFSSISHLREFSIDTVKIDRSMMPGKAATPKQRALFKSLVEMIRSLDLAVVAEGVETEAQKDLCEEYQVEYVQGFYYSRPVSPEEVEQKYLANE